MGHMKWMCARSDQWAFVDTRDTSSYSADFAWAPFIQVRQSSSHTRCVVLPHKSDPIDRNLGSVREPKIAHTSF